MDISRIVTIIAVVAGFLHDILEQLEVRMSPGVACAYNILALIINVLVLIFCKLNWMMYALIIITVIRILILLYEYYLYTKKK